MGEPGATGQEGGHERFARKGALFRRIAKRTLRKVHSLPLTRTLDYASRAVPLVYTLHRRAEVERGVFGHDPQALGRQLEYILQLGYRPVTMETVDAWVRGADVAVEGAVAFVFDDGYWDQAELIEEIFLPRGIPVSVFLITDFVDGETWPWDARIRWIISNTRARRVLVRAGSLERRAFLMEDHAEARRRTAKAIIEELQYLSPHALEAAIYDLAREAEIEVPEKAPSGMHPISWEKARELERLGVKFGSHSANHYVLSSLSDAEAANELKFSFQRLKAELASPLSIFCYPFGGRRDYGARDILLLRSTGYTSAVNMIEGTVERAPARYKAYSVNRFGLPQEIDDLLAHSSRIARSYRWVLSCSPFEIIRRRYGSPLGFYRTIEAVLRWRAGRLHFLGQVDWRKVRRLVFLCHGNVCRSPFAEAVARDIGLPAISIGLKTDGGIPPNATISRLALEMGIDLSQHRSRRAISLMLRDGDLMLGMEPKHLVDPQVASLPAGVQRSLLGLFCRQKKYPYIHDPYGLPEAYGRRCLGLIQEAVVSLAKEWANAESETANRFDSV